MKKSLPEEWIRGEKNSLNVLLDLGIKCPVSNLFIYRGPRKKTGKMRSKGLYCRWLPAPEEDIRPEAIKYTGGTSKGKRKYLEGTTGEEDPYIAGRIAVEWYTKQRNQLTELAKELEYNSNYSLKHYWEKYFADFEMQYINKRGGRKRIVNERSTWFADRTGICHQPFVSKSIDRINYKDLLDYWQVLDKKGAEIGSDMSKAKKAIKTQINKLFTLARENQDFPKLEAVKFPTIHTHEKKEAVYLNRNEFDNLLMQIEKLGGYAVNTNLNHQDFLDLPWNNRDRCNERNFVELYDAVQVMWYFYLRAEDMPRLRNEWFEIVQEDDGEMVAKLQMEQAKGFRGVKISEAYRPEAVDAVRRMLNRRKENGYFLFDWYARPKLNPSGSQVLDTLNTLLQHACSQVGIQKQVIWTSLRHTAFMETLREFPILNEVRELNIFADNAYTSADTLRKHYLNKIDRQSSAKRARKIAVADPYANMSLQERSRKVREDIKAKREPRDKKFYEMDKAEGRQPNK